MRNTLEKEKISQDLGTPASDAALREDTEQKKGPQKKAWIWSVRSMTESPEPRRGRFESPRKKDSERRTVFKRLEKGVFHRLEDKGRSMFAYLNDSRRQSYHSSCGDTESYHQSSRSRETEFASEKRHNKRASSRSMEPLSGSEDSAGGHWKSKPKRQKSSIEDDLIYGQDYQLELIKRLHDKILKLVDEMMRVTTAFLRGEVAASSRERKKSLPSWKQQEARQKQNFNKEGFRNQQRSEGKQDMFIILTKTPKEILALDKGKFKPPPPMTTPVKNGTLANFLPPGRSSDRGCTGVSHTIAATGTLGAITRALALEKHSLPLRNIITKECPHTGQKLCQKAKVVQESTGSPVDEMIRITTSFLRGEVAAGNQERKKLLPSWKQQEARHKQCFKKEPTDMTGVPRHVVEHRLNILEGCPPIRQKRRSQAADRNRAIQEEVEKLVNASIMKEVHYHSWLSNPKSYFYWTEEADAAFKQMNQLKAELPTLTLLKEKEELIICLAAAKEAQTPKKILPSTPNYSGHGPAHKATEFIVKLPKKNELDTAMEVEEELLEPRILFTDESSYADGSGARLILTNPKGA
nr:reverse transcriptase domain-containing protein [Tanacetum cinerariifolium]